MSRATLGLDKVLELRHGRHDDRRLPDRRRRGRDLRPIPSSPAGRCASPWSPSNSIGAGGGSLVTIRHRRPVDRAGERRRRARAGRLRPRRHAADRHRRQRRAGLSRSQTGAWAAPSRSTSRRRKRRLRRSRSASASASSSWRWACSASPMPRWCARWRRVTVERGVDGRQCTLLAFGGAGPMHAARLAREFGIAEIVVPRFSSGFSALGCIVADMSYTQQQAVRMLSTHWDAARFGSLHDGMLETLMAPLHAPGPRRRRRSPSSAPPWSAMSARATAVEVPFADAARSRQRWAATSASAITRSTATRPTSIGRCRACACARWCRGRRRSVRWPASARRCRSRPASAPAGSSRGAAPDAALRSRPPAGRRADRRARGRRGCLVDHRRPARLHPARRCDGPSLDQEDSA